MFGVPADGSAHLIRSETIRKVTFTGSTAVGRQVARLAAEGLKPCTLELGGHAKDSGYGNEGGHEGLEGFMHPKYVHHVT